MLISLTDEKQIKALIGSYIPKSHIFLDVDNQFNQASYTLYVEGDIKEEHFINYNSTLEYLKQNNLITKMPKWDGSYYIGPRYDDYYIIAGHFRDSRILEESNYTSIKEFLEKNKINFIEVSFNHWAVGWIEYLMVQEDNIKDIEFINDEILDKLEDYPVFDEDDFYTREFEEAEKIKEDMIKDLRHTFRNKSMSYEEKKAYAKRCWYLELGIDKIMEKALEMVEA
jgi:hypothetical protein